MKATVSILTRFWMNGFLRKPTKPLNWSSLFNFDPFLMVFASNPTGLCKSKQPFQFWAAFQWFLQEIQLDQENQSKPFNFDPFLNGVCKKSKYATVMETNFLILTRVWMVFCRKSYQTTQIEATFSILIRFWMVFQEIQLGYANRNKLFNFDPFLNGFCKKSY